MTRARPASESVLRHCGFSLIELLVVIAILGIVCGAIFLHLSNVQQRSTSEMTKLDYFQEARDFVDQFFRDINQIGNPNGRTVVAAVAARGLVSADVNSISFDAALDGTGAVQTVTYQINGSGACPACLQRSQVPQGAPASWGTEVNNVANNAANPIFTYYDIKGKQVTTLPADNNTLASIKTIKISLILRNPSVTDLKTHQAIEMPFEGEVSINNCSMIANSQPMSCF